MKINISLLVIAVVTLLAGCDYKTPESVVNDIKKAGGTKTAIEYELRELHHEKLVDHDDFEAAIYNYAFDKNFYDIAMEGWIYANRSKLNFLPNNFLTSNLFKSLPGRTNFAYGLAIFEGTGYPRNDFRALKHFITAAVYGDNDAPAYMYSIYKQYQCSSQAMMMYMLHGPSFNGNQQLSLGSPPKMADKELIEAQKKAAQLDLIKVKTDRSISDYPFDDNCLIDGEVKKLIDVEHTKEEIVSK